MPARHRRLRITTTPRLPPTAARAGNGMEIADAGGKWRHNSVNLLCFYYTDVLVSSAVIKEISVAAPYHTLDKDDIGYLTNFFPFFPRPKNRLFATIKQSPRIFAIEDRNCGAINQLVIGAVVDQNNTLRGHNRRRPGFHYAGVKLSWPSRQDRRLGGISPVNQVSRIGKPHLVVLVRCCPEKVHPVFAVDFLRHNGA